MMGDNNQQSTSTLVEQPQKELIRFSVIALENKVIPKTPRNVALFLFIFK